MTVAGSRCPECGAAGGGGSCLAQFHALLALDHQRLQPWGRYHGLNVACFLLQHPSTVTTTVLGGQWEMVAAHLDGGLPALEQVQTDRVRRNRGTNEGVLRFPAPPVRVREPSVTIADVSVDGTFPAEGYAARMRSWAESIALEREQGHRVDRGRSGRP